MARPIDLWFSVGSTYTFLSAMRLEVAEREHGVHFACRPFSVRAIMVEKNDVTFRGSR